MNNFQLSEYLNMMENYDNIKIEDLEENNISVQSIPIDSNIQNNESNIKQVDMNNNETIISNIDEGPLKLIEIKKNKIEVNPDALRILRSIKEEIIVISIVGKARTGKSYLMNLLLNSNNINNKCNNGFKVASSIKSCTKGIWLWNTPRQKPNSSSKIIFIDSEGTNSVDFSTKSYDSKIFALIILLSSLFIYNTQGNIDEQSIGELSLSTYLHNYIAFNNKTAYDKNINISDLNPKFIWVLRDFTLEKVDPETGDEITSDEYLELCLRNKTSKNNHQNNIIRENIIKYFKERECITLPRPLDKEENLQNLNNIPFCNLKSNFRTEFLILKKKVYETSKPKIFNGKKVTGPILADLLTIFVKAINSGIIPNIDSAWNNIVLNELETFYSKCKDIWKNNIKKNIGILNVKSLYNLKYIIIGEYINVIGDNGEIMKNKIYYDKFKYYKNKLDNEIQKEINKINLNINKQKSTDFKNIINNNYTILDTNLVNNIYDKKSNNINNFSNDLMEDYKNLLIDIKNNCVNENNNGFYYFLKTDLNISESIINYINSYIQRKINIKKNEIEKQIENNENESLLSKNIIILNNKNDELDNNFFYLKKELEKKNKEIMHLIGKYTIIVEKRDELISKNNFNVNNNEIYRNNALFRNSRLKTSTNQLYYDTDTKACGCQFKDEICHIF